MINNQYQLYIESIVSLAETIVIKFDEAATALNEKVKIDHGWDAVNVNDPGTWKYYQNIAGEYHSTDTPMVINSLDLPEQIVFNKENLAIHRSTKAAYAYGSRYYRELVLQYPEQELLILGILYPADKQAAIDAKDGTILSYPSHLVEEYEYSFIRNLQKWIYNYLDRWVVGAFSITDDLYIASYMGQLYMHLVPAIVCLRKQACHTNEVHSYHLQQYLASHGYLDEFLKYLLRDQALFLYRNIRYIERFAGKKDTFEVLTDKIITRRNFPFYEYAMNHRVKEMERGDLFADLSASNLLPEPVFKRKAINVLAQNNDAIDYSLPQVFSKVAPLAPYNTTYQEFEATNIRQTLAYSKSSVVATKMLESSVRDYSNVVTVPIEKILFNHWLAWVCDGTYRSVVNVKLPHSSVLVRLEAQDAVALFLYALTRSVQPSVYGGSSTDPLYTRIPSVYTTRIIKDPVPSLSDLRKYANPRLISDELLQQFIDQTAVQTTTLNSLDSFYDKCVEILRASNLQYKYYSVQEHYQARGQMQMVSAQMHEDRQNALTDLRDPGNPNQGMLYEDWLTQIGLELPDYTEEMYNELALNVVMQATGMNKRSPTKLSEVQKAMVDLFTKLSSYSIQVVRDASVENIIAVPRPDLRVGDIYRKHNAAYYADPAPIRVLREVTTEKNEHFYDVNAVVPVSDVQSLHRSSAEVDIALLIDPLDIGRNGWHTDPTLRANYSLSFSEAVNQYDQEQQTYIIDVYGHNPDLSSLVTLVYVGRINYVGNTKQIELIKNITEEVNFDPIIETANTVSLNAQSMVGGTVNLPGFISLNEEKELAGNYYVGNTKELDLFQTQIVDEALGEIIYVGNTKELAGLQWASHRRELSGMTMVGASKTLPGFEMTETDDGQAYLRYLLNKPT